MKRSTKSTAKERRKGCVILALAAAALAVLVVLFIHRSVGEAKRTEQTLNETFGEALTFVPAADGSIAPERIEAFLRVRAKVRKECPAMQDRLGDGFRGLKKLFEFGPAFLRFMEARNHALLDERMGLGEYMYIYVLAYAEPLARVDESPFAETEQARVGNRSRGELLRILQNQLDSFAPGEITTVPEGQIAALRDQIARLGSGEQGLPWEDGLPPAIAASLEPYQEALAGSYCEGIARIELMQKNKGFNVRN